MIRIGDFARLCQVSVVTLRHYDEIGLLKPVAIDRFTSYRYYSVSQLPRLFRILALKDLGFTLEQIEATLTDDLTLDQLRGMVKMKRAEAEQRIAQEQERLTRLEAWLAQIELEENMPNYDIVLKTVPPMLVASRRITIPTNDQVPAYLGPAYNEVYEHIKQQQAKDTGTCLTIWHTTADTHTNEDAEAMVPIDRPIPSSDRVQVYELPQTYVASVVHEGDFSEFTQGHKALLKWMEANGYRPNGPFREIYIRLDHATNDSTTEIQYPVEKV
jgi:DNA-binding transcriptional MerR regulator